MKQLELFYLFFSGTLLFINGCSTVDDQNLNDEFDDISTQRTNINYHSDSTNKVVMIYDYDPEFSKLHYKPVNIKSPTGDKLMDALQAFIDYNHFLEPTDNIFLDRVVRNEDQTTLYFSGLANSKAQKDKREFFKKALELTIARNFHGKNIKVVLNEENP